MAFRRFMGTQQVLACKRHPELPRHWLVKLRAMAADAPSEWITVTEAEYAKKRRPAVMIDDIRTDDRPVAPGDWSGSITT